MHQIPVRRSIAAIGAVLVLWTCGFASGARAEPSFFTSDCAGCHNNDTPTCNGCHHHRGTLSATADHAQYYPGDPVTVTLGGGSRTGWIRGLLYDQTGAEIDRRTGPTGTGDDGLGSPVTFPVTLHGIAPATPGDYTWNAAWFGNDDGSGHIENRRAVTIHVVEAPVDVQQGDPPGKLSTWSRIKSLFK